MKFRWALVGAAACLLVVSAPSASVLRLNLRSRVEAFRGSGEWREVHFARTFQTQETALIICDMWDRHWCGGATGRVNALARKAAPVIDRARRNGILIIHAPSETMNFYRDAPQRKYVLGLSQVAPPQPLQLESPPLPIDDSDGGCDTPGDRTYKAWSREIPIIHIASDDVISDDGRQVYTVLRKRGIRNLLVMGVHANMCILNRSFAIKQMTKWGIRCVLLRDLTDAMYNPNDAPFVSHQRGTELVIEYIEKYWAPSTTSEELMAALPER
jgi:nicotinamidase-related amidase